jgi:hypothetical protein
VREDSLSWNWGSTAPAKTKGSVLARATARAKMLMDSIVVERWDACDGDGDGDGLEIEANWMSWRKTAEEM